MAALFVLPTQNWQIPVTPAATLNKTKPSAQVAAEYATLRVIYGQPRVAAQIANVVAYAGQWVIQAIWGEGPIDSLSDIAFGDEAATGTAVHYGGTLGQPVDPTLAAAIPGYADTLPGIAYSVFKLPASTSSGMPTITARVKGRKLYDPRTGLTAWSRNPALALADLITNSDYGRGYSIDWASVTAVANACDTTIGGKPRRALDLSLESAADADEVIATLSTYAGCWAIRDSTSSRASTATYIGSDGLIKTAAIDVVRHQYDPSNLALPATLLREGAATNLLTYSEQFNNGVWSSGSCTRTPNAIAAPDGTMSADRLLSTDVNITFTRSFTATEVAYCYSVFVKRGITGIDATKFLIRNSSTAINLSVCDINWTTKTATYGGPGGGAASMSDVGGGWYRVAVTAVSGISVGNTVTLYCGYSGGGPANADVYVWGAQLEVGAVATSYIPTTSVPVTRAADVIAGTTILVADRPASVAVKPGTANGQVPGCGLSRPSCRVAAQFQSCLLNR